MESPIRFDDPCLIFALHREARPFLLDFPPQQRFPGGPCWARFCGPAWLTVLVLETGIGARLADKALDWVLQAPSLGGVPYRPRVVISAGFSGALQADLGCGAVVLATEIVDEQGSRWPTTWPGKLPPGQWQPPLHSGRILCTAQLEGEPHRKRLLGNKHDALALDMETAAIARRCSKLAIPFGAVRAISDDVDTRLAPNLVSLLSANRVSALALGRVLLGSPRLAGDLWRLAKQTRHAAQQLKLALGELLTLTLPWGREL